MEISKKIAAITKYFMSIEQRMVLALLFALSLGCVSPVIAGGAIPLPKKEKAGDWLIETYNNDITVYIDEPGGAVTIDCVHDKKYASVRFHLLKLGLPLKQKNVDVKVRIDENDAISFANKKSLSIEIYISDFGVPYSKNVSELFKQMREGNVMVFEVTGGKNGTSDKISLKGFTKAHNALKKSCA